MNKRGPKPKAIKASRNLNIRIRPDQEEAYKKAANGKLSKWVVGKLDQAAKEAL